MRISTIAEMTISCDIELKLHTVWTVRYRIRAWNVSDNDIKIGHNYP